MKYAFSREQGIEEWEKVNEALVRNLDEIREGNCREEEMKEFLLKACNDAMEANNKEMVFWAYDEPERMPTDARCEYAYKPTYLMTLCMIGIINRKPELIRYSDTREVLYCALNACAGRSFIGCDNDSYQELCSNVLLFMRNGILKFMRSHPLFSVRFEGCFRNALNTIEQDRLAERFTRDCGGNCKELQDEILKIRYGKEE